MAIFKRFDHIGIVVSDLKKATKAFAHYFDLECEEQMEIPAAGIRIAFYSLGVGQMELIEFQLPFDNLDPVVTRPGASVSAIILTFLMPIDPNIPHNDGLTRPLHIHIPEGTFLNARFPAATTFGNSITGPNADAILKAMAQALPHRVTAGWNRMPALAVSGHDLRVDRPYVDILFNALKGGSGATWGYDGYDHIRLINCAGGILALDPEMFELQTPNVILKHEYAPDSAGAGRWRGGLGVETVIRFNGEKSKGVVFGDGIDEEARAFGIFSGQDGAINELEFRFPDGNTHRPQSKEIVPDIPTGTVMRQVAGGGGGYGAPCQRPAEQVAKDVCDGLLSLQKARAVYGVVVNPETLEVDSVETDRLRAIRHTAGKP
jgi:N-methylhydantoinase B